MDVRIVGGNPTPLEAQVIERAFAALAARAKADAANAGDRRNAWTMSGRLAAHGAATQLSRLR